MKYRKKPVVVEAVKIVYAEMLALGPECSPFSQHPSWLIDALAKGVLALSTKGARDYAVIDVKTLAGVVEATPGDWLIRGVEGELYPCQPHIFELTYEPAQDDPAVPNPAETPRLPTRDEKEH